MAGQAAQPEPAAPPAPPMFAASTGDGDPCNYCRWRSITTLKRRLPDGYQACPACDAGPH